MDPFSSKSEISPEKKKWTLQKETEFRFEVADKSAVKITLLTGFAECFGSELAKGKEYIFVECNSCIFTWQGCTLEVEGDCKAYIGEQTPMVAYGNVHCILQKMRSEALANKTVGPKIMIVGSTDSGKSSLCKLLCNYAARQGEQPIFADLDIGQGVITIPGMVAAIPIERPIDPEEGFGISQPILQFFGEVHPGKNTKFYIEQLKNLSKECQIKFENDANVAASGLIINTCGWVEGDGYNILLDTIEVFSPTVIFVIGHEKLYSGLTTDIKDNNLKIVKLPKSGGVVSRDTNWRRKSRRNKIHEYFYGINHEFCPHQVVLSFNQFSMYKIVAASLVPSSTLPLGMEQSIDNVEIIKVTPSPDMKFLIAGVSYAKNEDEIINSNIAGMLYITEINFDKQTIVALSPCSGPIPGEFLILSGIKFIEVD